MQDKIFYLACFGFLFGVFLRSFVLVNFYFVVFLTVISLATFLLFFIFKNNWGIIATIFVLTFSFGIFRFNTADKPAPLVFESKVGEKIILSGILSDEPSIRENNQHLVVKLPERRRSVYDDISRD